MSSQVEKCLGCGNYARAENITPVFVLNGNRAIGHVHKRPPDARADLLHPCHRFAFELLKERFPTIVIEGRTLDKNTRFVKSGRRSGSYTAVKFAGGSSGEPRYATHLPTHATLRSPTY